MTKIVISSVPWTDTSSPLMAPAVLKSALKVHGIDSVAFDLNAEVKQRISKSSNRSSILKFFLKEEVDSCAQDDLIDIFEFMAERILSTNPEWVLLSLMTYLSQIPTRWLCFLIKKKNPNVKIVIGGAGCSSSLKSLDSFTQSLKSQRLIDHYIVGDGEIVLPELIKGRNQLPGVDSSDWKEIKDLDRLPLPDYDDYDWSLYSIKRVSVLGSRGCVRECTFCDIHEHWSKFTWRTAKSIFDEIKTQYEKYGINVISFADSLVNGNQKEYRELIRLLAEYNESKPEDQRIRWTGFFIFRPLEQMKEEDWRLTAASGAVMLNVGVESFVEHIRYHIKKKFSNRDLEYGLEMAKKYGVGVTLLTIVGYVTETQKDHEEQLEWIRNNRHYAGDPVKYVNVGSGLSVLPGTWLEKNAKSLGLKLSSTEVYQDWENPAIGSTPELRMKWHAEVVKELKENGFTAYMGEDNHALIEAYLRKKYETIKD